MNKAHLEDCVILCEWKNGFWIKKSVLQDMEEMGCTQW